MKHKKTFEVISSGGVFVRYTNNPMSGIVRVIESGTKFEAEVTQGHSYVRVEDGYVLNEPYILKEVTDTSHKQEPKTVKE